jgi:nucleotide-binding universal stress UspA family protein
MERASLLLMEAKLLLAHVLDPAGAANPMESSPSDLGKLSQSAKLALQEVSQGVLAAQGIKGEVLVRYGNVRDMIFQVKQEYSADIVVLGSSGRKIGRGKALGSIAEAIIRSLPCSVLTIGPNVEQPLLSANAQAVLFPTNFSPASLAAIPTAISLVADLSASLLRLHVCDPYEPHSCFPVCTAVVRRCRRRREGRVRFVMMLMQSFRKFPRTLSIPPYEAGGVCNPLFWLCKCCDVDHRAILIRMQSS